MTETVTLADAHVHVHAETDVPALLDAAAGNFSMAATKSGAHDWQGVLMLAEMRGVYWFEEIHRSRSRFGRWSVEPVAGDPVCVEASAPGVSLIIMAGRQIVTVEGIEVLALATSGKIDDGLGLTTTIELAASQDAIVVLPWGAGKWLGRRGRLVKRAIDAESSIVFAGDNGGRPAFWPEGAIFPAARARGRAVLPGSDPLRLRGEERRVGSFGFCLAGKMTYDFPSRWLRERLRHSSPPEVRTFGRLLSTMRFLRNQTALRLYRPPVGAA